MKMNRVIISTITCLILSGCESDVAIPRQEESTVSTGKPALPQPESNPLPAHSSPQAPFEQSGVPNSAADSQPLIAPRSWRLLIPEKQFSVIPGTDALSVSFSDLSLKKILAMRQIPADAAEHFPAWLRQLEGKRVRISGYMYPPFKETNLSEFVLVPDAQLMNFGRAIRADEAIEARLQKDTTTDYQVNRRFDVEGIFRIVPMIEDGELWGLYQLEEARLIFE